MCEEQEGTTTRSLEHTAETLEDDTLVYTYLSVSINIHTPQC